jgi:hypothetical protein
VDVVAAKFANTWKQLVVAELPASEDVQSVAEAKFVAL